MSAGQSQPEVWRQKTEAVRYELGIDSANVRVAILLRHGEQQSRIEFTDLGDRTAGEIVVALRLEMAAAMEDFKENAHAGSV